MTPDKPPLSDFHRSWYQSNPMMMTTPEDFERLSRLPTKDEKPTTVSMQKGKTMPDVKKTVSVVIPIVDVSDKELQCISMMQGAINHMMNEIGRHAAFRVWRHCDSWMHDLPRTDVKP